MSTYAEDTDITNADPFATQVRPSGDSDFERVRTLAYDEINRRLSRRNPPVDAPSSLADSSELTEAEVRFALHYLYRDAASVAADSLYWEKAKHWLSMAEAEITTVQVSVGVEDVKSVQSNSAPIWRS